MAVTVAETRSTDDTTGTVIVLVCMIACVTVAIGLVMSDWVIVLVVPVKTYETVEVL